MLVPKLVTTLKSYDRQQFVSDLTAGTIVGIVALPLAIAFAIASGVTPERGLYTAIVAGFLISALGGSRVQIGGPTGAFVVIVYGIVQQYGLEGLTAATLMAGVILVLMGVARLGTIIKFIPQPLITGFTSGIAVIIFTSQVKDFLGLKMGSVPADFVEKVGAYAEHITSITPEAIGVAVVALAIIIWWPRVNRKMPSPFVALIVTTAGAQLLGLPIETIGSRFGELSASLPHPVWPDIRFSDLQRLVSPAFTIALLGAIESLLSAVVADGMIGSRHRSNMELVAQGVANIASPIFGGIPATGAIARTATNVKNGGRTPVAGMVHALVLLLITLFFGKWAGLIPMATLAAILVVVAYHMSEWRTFVDELRGPRADVAVLLVSFVLTVIVDLTVAIEVGMVLAAFLFMHRMSEVTQVSAVRRELQREQGAEDDDEDDRGAAATHDIPEGVDVYEITGAFFFGAAETFKDTVNQVARKPKVLVIRMRHVSMLDATGLRALRDVVRRSKGDRALVLIAEIHAQPLAALERSPLAEELGRDAIFLSLDDALDRARSYLAARTPTPPRGGPSAGTR
ncbi:MAG: sodium-independent anion transporter [Gemmatimonadetes bacterium SCN 70-22]|nr:MAG: sodium-independent anion transporter [Gemmatimonadetes bacterium SCN 70-22]